MTHRKTFVSKTLYIHNTFSNVIVETHIATKMGIRSLFLSLSHVVVLTWTNVRKRFVFCSFFLKRFIIKTTCPIPLSEQSSR